MDIGTLAQRGVDCRLERAGRTAPVAAVGGDDDPRVGILDAALQSIGREAAEDHGVRRTQPGAGQHRDGGLRDHRHVDGDPVALADAELGEGVRGLADRSVQVGVGDRAGVARLALPVDGDLVAVSCLDMAVDAVVRDVELRASEPFRERRVRPVEHLIPLGFPGDQLPGLARPESQPVGGCLVVQSGVGIGPRRELVGRREAPLLAEEVGQCFAGHVVNSSASCRRGRPLWPTSPSRPRMHQPRVSRPAPSSVGARPCHDLDELRAEGRKVVGLAARDEVRVDDDLQVDPVRAGVAQVGLQGRP